MRATLIATATLLLAGLSAATAQTALGPVNQGRECQTVRTCNFDRNAEVRGCLSSYTCRSCKLVAAKCQVGAAQGICQRFRCSFGG